MVQPLPKLFAIELRITGTAYIRAESKEQAMIFARNIADGKHELEFPGFNQLLSEHVCMDGRPFEKILLNPEEIALSPVFTVDKQLLTILNLIEVEIEHEAANDQ